MAYKKYIGGSDDHVHQKAATQYGKGLPRIEARPQLSDYEFYQIEPAMVYDLATEDHPNLAKIGGFAMIGAVQFKYLYSNVSPSIKDLPWALPLSGNLREYPLAGELVEIVEYFGIPFYGKRVNWLNTVNGSIAFDIGHQLDSGVGGTDFKKAELVGPRTFDTEDEKPGQFFFENHFIQPLNPSEGDVSFEGRFGNTLRLGHMAREEGKNPYELANIKLRVGQLTDAEANDRGSDKEEAFAIPNRPLDEHINDDGCSLWMTLGEEVLFSPGKPTEPAENLFKSLEAPPEVYDGKQIILNSDRIIFNTKAKEMMCFSKGDTYFNSTSNFIIDTDKDFIMQNLGNCKIESDGYIYIR